VAVLRAAEPGRSLPLPAHCVIGRARACDLVLAEKSVSGQHAAIEWTGGEWELRDLGSRNGTYLDNKKLTGGARAVLTAGMRLRFGLDAAVWTLLDVAPPQLMARHLGTGEHRIADGGYLVLPEVSSSACSLSLNVHLPTSAFGTFKDSEQALLLAHLRLSFQFTRDEEHVELTAWSGDRSLFLQARAHHYPLLLLARRRLADQASGVPEPEQGWIRQDELTRMLRMDDNHLNISIHRARTQLGQQGVLDAAALVQRRSGTRQLRIGAGQLELHST